MRAALRHASFRRLLAALAVSQAGDWLYNPALLAFVYERTHSATWVAVTTAARVAPIVVLGPLGGVAADRCDRRRLMIGSDLVRALCMMALVAVAVLGLPVALAPVFAAAAVAASSPYGACVSASTPRLVPDADLPAANAARSAIGAGCIVAGPAIGAVLLAVGSPAVAFAANGASFVLSALVVASLTRGAVFAPGGSAHAILADLAAGARALRARRSALMLAAADLLCSALYGAQTLLLLLAFGAHRYGLLLAACGLGGVIAAGFASRLTGTSRRVLAGGLLLAGAPTGLLALTNGLVGPIVLCLLSGAGAILVEVLAETGLQRTLPDEVFARAYGLVLPASLAGIVAGSLLAAPLASAIGARDALIAIGVAVVTGALGLLSLSVRSDRDHHVSRARRKRSASTSTSAPSQAG